MDHYLGDFAPGATIRRLFNSEATADGAPITLAGTPVAKVYKDGSTTEVTTGVTLTVGFDTVTGLHSIVVDTSSDGTFYAAGSDFFVVLTAGTVDGISVVGKILAHFSLFNRALNVKQKGLVPRDVSAVSDANITVEDCLIANVVEMGGQEAIVGTAWTKKTPAGTTVRVMALDSATAPTART